MVDPDPPGTGFKVWLFLRDMQFGNTSASAQSPVQCSLLFSFCKWAAIPLLLTRTFLFNDDTISVIYWVSFFAQGSSRQLQLIQRLQYNGYLGQAPALVHSLTIFLEGLNRSTVGLKVDACHFFGRSYFFIIINKTINKSPSKITFRATVSVALVINMVSDFWSGNGKNRENHRFWS